MVAEIALLLPNTFNSHPECSKTENAVLKIYTVCKLRG